MSHMSLQAVLIGATIALVSPCEAIGQEGVDADRVSRYERFLDWPRLMDRRLVSLAYTPDGTRLYYSVSDSDSISTYTVRLGTGEVRPLFDMDRLRASVAEALGKEPTGRGTPFRRFSVSDGEGQQLAFSAGGSNWILDLETYEISAADSSGAAQPTRPRVLRAGRFGRPAVSEVPSPDGRYIATVIDSDAAIREVASDSTYSVSSDGTPDDSWGYDGVGRSSWAWWSPSGRYVALRRADFQGVDSIPMIEWLTTPPKVTWLRNVHNVREAQALPRERMGVWDTDTQTLRSLNLGDTENAFLRVLGWRPDGSELITLKVTRDHSKVSLLASNPIDGTSRVLHSEAFDTCFTTPAWFRNLRSYWPLSDGRRFIWKSDLDGWAHLYLHAFHGDQVVRLTSGAWQVDDIIGIDEERGWVYFSARTDKARPYDLHIHRVRLDGSDLSQITVEPGRYGAELTPGSEHVELWRRTLEGPTTLHIHRTDGTPVHEVTVGRADRLVEAGWTRPEEFTVKAADGQTELWGVLFKPADFDPSVNYPIVDLIYGGPVVEYAPRILPHWSFPSALAQLGYVVVMLDARGTPGRGRVFLESGFNRPSVVIADHGAALRQLAERHSYLDLTRVGIAGQSWGGDFTARAMFLAPELFKAGVAVSGGWWSEPSLGAAKATISEQCAVLRAGEPQPSIDRLSGKLMIVHGTDDANMSGSTDLMRWLDKVRLADKYVDLLVLPGSPHDMIHAGDRYVLRAIADYFEEHLKGE